MPHPHSHADGVQRTLSARHDHVFLGKDHRRNERRTWIVIAVTTVMMIVEIVAGGLFGSMALVADGWHMSTHAAAMLISALAYLYARRHSSDPRFTFGTGKLGDLAAFASAIVLALVAVLIGWESLLRLAAPVAVDVSEAIAVAVIGLAVNLVCAWILKDDHGHSHGHSHHHDHDHGDHAHDHASAGGDTNLRSAYLHVLADALTSVLAIVALLLAGTFGWLWADPAMGLVGAAVILQWSWSLVSQSGATLLDFDARSDLPARIRNVMAHEDVEIADLHVWRLGPGHHGAIVSIIAGEPQAPSYYRGKLAQIGDLSHVTVEIEPRAA